MLEVQSVARPQLSSMQRLWLLEIGLDRPALARLTPAAAKSVPKRVAAPSQTGSTDSSPQHALQGEAVVHDASAQASAALAALRKTGAYSPQRQVPETESTRVRPELVVDPAQAAGSAEVSAWSALEARILACEACGLHAGRHRAVPGAGATESTDWFVVGEAPGDRDDRRGEPFQGKAGDLLKAMLKAAGIEPEQAVFYTNLVKCRPRGNRPPSGDEIAACLPYLRSQVAMLRPRGILVLGRLAAQALVADGKSFEEQRGHVHGFQTEEGQAIPMVVTYHPASLLSRPQHKAASWRDLSLARGAVL